MHIFWVRLCHFFSASAFAILVWHLQLVGGVEVVKGDNDTLGHGLLTLTDPDSWVVVPAECQRLFSGSLLPICTHFLLGLSSPSGLPT
jgi:hypothetical protein